MGVPELDFELLAQKAEIKGVFDRLYCWYGNVVCQERMIITWSGIRLR